MAVTMQERFERLWATPEEYQAVIGLFLKGLAVIYLIAFATLSWQIAGFAGKDGILPLVEQQANLAGQVGLWRFLASPSLFWLNASDEALVAATWAGCAAALLLLLGLWPRLLLIVSFCLYLSLYHAGNLFMNFQWDTLLLETGFLAILLVHGGSRLVVYLLRWLLFRLRFLSGIAKLASGDAGWWGLTALDYYFETQPLPHVGAWYAHHLPHWLLATGTLATLAIEILVPFLFIAPRRYRMAGAFITIGLQLLIIATSNHNFINLLTILLCLFLFDDQALRAVLPERLVQWLAGGAARQPGRVERRVLAAAASVIVVVTVWQVLAMTLGLRGNELTRQVERVVASYGVAARYHVFPTVTQQRPEIVVEWSMDGTTWHPLDFGWKVGDPWRRPEFIVPRHPRLDWELWFLPHGYPAITEAYERFLERLLEGSPSVLSLLPAGTFKGGPPKFLRGSIWRYRFADAATRRRTGQWWTMEYVGPFFPQPYLSREMLAR
jgi:hypothetical protein